MKYRKFSLSMDETLLARVDAVAKAETRNRSQQISHLVRLALVADPRTGATARHLEKLMYPEGCKCKFSPDKSPADTRECPLHGPKE